MDSVTNRISKGATTRRQILKVAVDIASAEGLEGLTIGRLARELEMSKSGLFGHFGSKEELQLAAVEGAGDVFVEEIIAPAGDAERGLERLRALLDNWLSYVERIVFRGGCFFAAASAEFDSRPGPVRDRIADLCLSWVRTLEEEVREAQSRSQLGREIDPARLVFGLHAFVQEANWAFQLLNDPAAFEKARESIHELLLNSSISKKPGRRRVGQKQRLEPTRR